MKKCSARNLASAGVLMRMVMKYLALGVAVQSGVQERVSLKLLKKNYMYIPVRCHKGWVSAYVTVSISHLIKYPVLLTRTGICCYWPCNVLRLTLLKFHLATLMGNKRVCWSFGLILKPSLTTASLSGNWVLEISRSIHYWQPTLRLR